MKQEKIQKLTLAAMLAAFAFICFTYLRIEIPMGGGMTGKIYIGHSFIILAALLLGAKYGALTGAVGLTLADVLAGYSTSAVPTFFSKLLIGLAVGLTAHQLLHIAQANSPKKQFKICVIATLAGCLTNIATEPLIRYFFKISLLGIPADIAKLSSINCLISMSLSAIPSAIIAVLLYQTLKSTLFHFRLESE